MHLRGAPSLDPSVDPTLGQSDVCSSPVEIPEIEENISLNVAVPQAIVPPVTDVLPVADDRESIHLVSQAAEADSSVHCNLTVPYHSDYASVDCPYNKHIDGDVVEQQVNNIFNMDNLYEDNYAAFMVTTTYVPMLITSRLSQSIQSAGRTW